MNSVVRKHLPTLFGSLKEDPLPCLANQASPEKKLLKFIKDCSERSFWIHFGFLKDNLMINVNLKNKPHHINIRGIFEAIDFDYEKNKPRHNLLHENSDLPFFKMKKGTEDAYGTRRLITCYKVNFVFLNEGIEKALLEKIDLFGIPVGCKLDDTIMEKIKNKYNNDFDGYNGPDDESIVEQPRNQFTYREKIIVKLAPLFLGLNGSDQKRFLKECTKKKLISKVDYRFNSDKRFQKLAKQMVSLEFEKLKKVFKILEEAQDDDSSQNSSSQELDDESSEESEERSNKRIMSGSDVSKTSKNSVFKGSLNSESKDYSKEENFPGTHDDSDFCPRYKGHLLTLSYGDN